MAILDVLEPIDPAHLADVAGRIDREIRDSLRSTADKSKFSGATIARYLHYLAMAIGEEAKKGSNARTHPNWVGIKGLYDNFLNNYILQRIDNIALARDITTDEISRFSTFETRIGGVRREFFYFSQLVFIIYLSEIRAFEHDLFSVQRW